MFQVTLSRTLDVQITEGNVVHSPFVHHHRVTRLLKRRMCARDGVVRREVTRSGNVAKMYRYGNTRREHFVNEFGHTKLGPDTFGKNTVANVLNSIRGSAGKGGRL